MAGTLQDKVALVTGGGSGIGQATCFAFARDGARVVVSDVNVPGGEETVAKIKESGGDATFISSDVTKASDVQDMVSHTVSTYSKLDYAFNSAGVTQNTVGGGGKIHEHSEATWDAVLNINLKGVWLCMKYEIAQMLEQGSGAIVNASSAFGLVGGGASSYTASKFGVVGLTRTAALEYAKHGIRVNCICPGMIDTPLVKPVTENPELRASFVARHPIGRLGKADEISEAVVWLCSDASSFVTGHAMAIDGGWTAQ